MKRLRYSSKAFIRSLQISRYSLFGFVEGKECDPFFYGYLFKSVCDPMGVLYQIRLACELPDKTGGKDSLIKFYRYLRQAGLLELQFAGRKKAVAFFLDKDIDDVLRHTCRSEHVIYTEHYDVENHIFLESELARGLASAASVDPNIVAVSPIFNAGWCMRAASRWKCWVQFCVFAQKYSIQGVCNYGVESRINTPLNGPEDPAEQKRFSRQLAAGYPAGPVNFSDAMMKVCRYVDSLYKSGRQDSVFKGKWYATLAELDLRDAFPGRPFHFDGLKRRITSALAATIDFNGNWANRLRAAIARIASKSM